MLSCDLDSVAVCCRCGATSDCQKARGKDLFLSYIRAGTSCSETTRRGGAPWPQVRGWQVIRTGRPGYQDVRWTLFDAPSMKRTHCHLSFQIRARQSGSGQDRPDDRATCSGLSSLSRLEDRCISLRPFRTDSTPRGATGVRIRPLEVVYRAIRMQWSVRPRIRLWRLPFALCTASVAEFIYEFLPSSDPC